MNLQPATKGLLLGLSFLVVSCSGSSFSSASGTTPSSGTPSSALAPSSANGSGSGATNVGTSGAGVDANANANGGGTAGTNSGANGCLGSVAKLYNISIIIDISGSQAQTDPTNLRISGTMSFLQQLATFADANPAVTINVSSVSFNDNAHTGAHGWQAISSKTLATIDGDITALTSTVSGGTYYMGALQASQTLFTSVQATTSPTQRNFILFLTDGEPNDFETIPQILAEITTLTQTQGVAMVTLGTGTEVTDAGATVLQNMALPTTGIVAADHIGQFFRVSTAAQMATIGAILSQAVSSCSAAAATSPAFGSTPTTGVATGTASGT